MGTIRAEVDSESRGLRTWLLGLAITVIIGGMGSWMAMVHSKVVSVDDLQRQRGERVAILEARFLAIKEQLDRIETEMKEIKTDLRRRNP